MREPDLDVKWFNTQFYPQRRTGRAVRYEDGVLPRLRQPVVKLFTPWGPRYDWEQRGTSVREGDREVQTLTYLADLEATLRAGMPSKRLHWMFMGADLYGTRINPLPAEAVGAYFESLRAWVRRLLPDADFRLWSEFDAEAEPYRMSARHRIEELLSESVRWQAIDTARKMGLGGDPYAYLVERLAEAMLIEERLHPIKISCVVRRKDDGVDAALPRLYLLPSQLQAPWR